MPETDSLFPQFPAEIHLLAAVERREIYQPDLGVLKLAAEGVNRLYCRLQAQRGRLFLPPQLGYLVAWRQHYPGNRDSLGDERDGSLRLLGLLFEYHQLLEMLLHFREQRFGFKQTEEAGHVTSSILESCE